MAISCLHFCRPRSIIPQPLKPLLTLVADVEVEETLVLEIQMDGKGTFWWE